jgi:ribosomal protein L16 Arg81 hydroxylase
MDWLTILIAVIISVIFNKYLPSYFSEKGKNTATKEDIEEITQKVEKVRASLSKEEKVLEKRRIIYEQIASSLRIFISGHNVSEEQKKQFYEAYAATWLWAPDQVVSNLNTFIESQIKHTSLPGSVPQKTMKKLYADVIVEMRKDVGFIDTKVKSENYVFAAFG